MCTVEHDAIPSKSIHGEIMLPNQLDEYVLNGDPKIKYLKPASDRPRTIRARQQSTRGVSGESPNWPMGKARYYAVGKGRVPGVYTRW